MHSIAGGVVLPYSPVRSHGYGSAKRPQASDSAAPKLPLDQSAVLDDLIDRETEVAEGLLESRPSITAAEFLRGVEALEPRWIRVEVRVLIWTQARRAWREVRP